MIIKKRLFTPGPTPILTRSLAFDSAELPHHRDAQFKALFRQCVSSLKTVFKTANEVVILTSSGTGAMESAVTNLLSPGDKAVVVSAGKFGERWYKLCQAYSVQADVIELPYGESVDPEEVRKRLQKQGDCRAVFVQACESSTGAAHDVKALGAIVAQSPDTLLVVDAITGLGTMDIQTDAWGLDVVIGGSQKAFMIPPGLAFLSLSPKALRAMERGKNPRFYFDLRKELAEQSKGQTAFTPAVHLVRTLKEALDFILQDGIDALIENAHRLALMTRTSLASLNMRPAARCPADAMTAAYVPDGVRPEDLLKVLQQEFGLSVAGGQGSMTGKIIRIAHLGYYDVYDLFALLSCLEIALTRVGCKVQLGTATRTALETYLQLNQTQAAQTKS